MQANKTVTLCPECGACPEIKLYDREVIIGEEGNMVKLKLIKLYDREVIIGEEGNMVKLKLDEWNTIVEKIQNGEIGKL